MTVTTQKLCRCLMAVVAAAALMACSSTRHVPAGEYLLENVRITVADSSDVSTKQFKNYLRQTPNHKVLGLTRLQLGIYNLSGASNSGFNRWLRKIGEEPVLFDSMLTEQSAMQLRLALLNAGYQNARVDYRATSPKAKKMNVEYRLYPGTPHFVKSIVYDIADSAVRAIALADTAMLPVQPGDLLNLNELENQRTLIVDRLHNHGYYAFSKDCISFIADTVAGEKGVELSMLISPPKRANQAQTNTEADHSHNRYRFRKVVIVPNFNSADNSNSLDFADRDTVDYRGYQILYSGDRYLSPKALTEQCFIVPGSYYSTLAVDRTYEAFNRLQILRYINIVTRPAGSDGDVQLLDTYILVSRTKKNGVSVELEGTNSEGDLGVGGGITYTNRNLARGGEVLTAKFRGAYESLSGNLEGLINDSYNEIAAEVGITFPLFKAPFLSSAFKRRMRASTEFALTFMRQDRPEYTRIIGGAAWRYKWSDRLNRTRRTFDLIDINVVNLPHSTIDFINHIAPNNPLLRYSYEDHFIMRMGYSWYHTNRRPASSGLQRYTPQVNTYTARASVEVAGNLLDAAFMLSGAKKHDGVYKIFGIAFSQYIKGEADYTINHQFTDRNSLSFHAGFGIIYPYGNSTIAPFEKRFYAGGANGVRGWSVRTLGPGSYDSRNSVTDFINQCGDISLLVNLEYRNKLFWVLEGALFVDAGNIWTIKNYPNQPGGFFRFGSFYKQLAASYGLGLRMDFEYFLLRLDMGVKAHNPATGQEKWPLFHPTWSRDVSFHFSVGYPF